MKTTLIIGILLILLGIIFLGPTLGLFTLTRMWPIILLLVGLGFFLAYFVAPTIYGLLMPGAVLVISSIPFFMCTFSGDWQQMSYLWPIFILAVSVGFFLMYFLGKREKGLLVPGFILFAFSAISFLIFKYIQFVYPILFISAGLILVFIGLVSNKKAKNKKSSAVAEQTAVD